MIDLCWPHLTKACLVWHVVVVVVHVSTNTRVSFRVSVYICLYQYIHPQKLTNVPLKKHYFNRKYGNTSSNHWFSGDMLIFGGVCYRCYTTQKNVLPNYILGKLHQANAFKKIESLNVTNIKEISNRTHWTDPYTCVSNSSSNLLRGPLVRSHLIFDGTYRTCRNKGKTSPKKIFPDQGGPCLPWVYQ